MIEMENFENSLKNRIIERLEKSLIVKDILGEELLEICALASLLNEKQRHYIIETLHQVLEHDL